MTKVTLERVIKRREEYSRNVYVQDFKGDDGALYVQFIFYPKRWTEKHFLTVKGFDEAKRVKAQLEAKDYKLEYGTGYFYQLIKLFESLSEIMLSYEFGGELLYAEVIGHFMEVAGKAIEQGDMDNAIKLLILVKKVETEDYKLNEDEVKFIHTLCLRYGES